MGVTTIILISLFFLWVLAHMKVSRSDGTLIKKLHPYRRLLSFIIPSSNGSVVYFDEFVNAENLIKYIEDAQKNFHVDITHCLVAAGGIALIKNPQMNRFSKGYRLYQRKGHFVTFTMKRKKLNQKSKVSAVKLSIKPDMTLYDLNQKTLRNINIERSDKKTSFDVEANLFYKLPRPMMLFCLKFANFLDYYNLLPSFMIKSDAMYTSMFIANLGSLGMKSGYHHLYDWGTCPHFITVGKIFDRPVVRDEKLVIEKSINIRFSYDERIEDGLNAYQGIKSFLAVLENPHKYLGCIKEDKSDRKTFNESASML